MNEQLSAEEQRDRPRRRNRINSGAGHGESRSVSSLAVGPAHRDERAGDPGRTPRRPSSRLTWRWYFPGYSVTIRGKSDWNDRSMRSSLGYGLGRMIATIYNRLTVKMALMDGNRARAGRPPRNFLPPEYYQAQCASSKSASWWNAGMARRSRPMNHRTWSILLPSHRTPARRRLRIGSDNELVSRASTPRMAHVRPRHIAPEGLAGRQSARSEERCPGRRRFTCQSCWPSAVG